MTEVRILAISILKGSSPRHITHVWTAGGAVPVHQAVDDLWRRRCQFYVLTPNGRVKVTPTPAKGPNLLQRLLGKPAEGRLASARTSPQLDALCSLPELPGPNRGRRSEQRISTTQAPLDITVTGPLQQLQRKS